MSNPSASVDICNTALYRLGASSITALNDGTVEANAVSLRYDWCRRFVLRSHWWKSAMKRAIQTATARTVGVIVVGNQYVIGVLGIGTDFTTVGAAQNVVGQQFIATATSPTYGTGGSLFVCPLFDYLYSIPLPTDCVRLCKVNYLTGNSAFIFNEEYRVEGRYIVMNDSTANINYVFDLTDVTVMDTNLIEAIGLYLAYDICYKITQANDLRNEIRKEYEQVLARARFIDSTEEPSDSIDPTVWISARTGLYGGFVRDPMTPE